MNLFHNPSASFDEPVSMLLACHGKVRRFCAQLDALPAHVAAHGMDEGACQAVTQIRRYFNQAAPLHHADEECDFFPLLLRYHPEAAADVALLTAEHETLHATWAALDTHLADLSAQRIQAVDAALIARFTALYAHHITVEEPWFGRADDIPAAELQAIGRVMAARRQAN